MIVFLVTPGHEFTLDAIRARHPLVRALSYADAFAGVPLPRATYVFADLDRLRPAGMANARAMHARMVARGWPVLNDPGRFVGRHDLLRRLGDAGINPFTSWRAAEDPKPARWPVLLRTERGHRGPLPRLLHDADALRQAIERAVASGRRLDDLIAVEYCAEREPDGLFRRLAVYRLGDRYVADACVYERHWIAKIGTPGIAGAERHADELRIVRDNPWAADAAAVFELAGVDYGRADFGLVGGRPCFYEINTNPHLDFDPDPEEPARHRAHRVVARRFLAALDALDEGAGAVDGAARPVRSSDDLPIRTEPSP